MRRLVPAFCVVLLVGLAAGLVALEEWHGPIVLSLSAGQGINTGDLLAVPLVGLAIAIWHREASAGEHVAQPVSRAGPASAIVLGVLLMLAGEVATAGGGPLVRSGGGTLNGVIDQASGMSPLPVDEWSDVAMT